MSIRNETILRVIVYEGTGSTPLPAADRYALVSALTQQGYAVTCVRNDGQVAPADHSAHVVLGRFSGPVPAQSESTRFHDITGLDAGQALSRVETSRTELQAPVPGAWKPWFPVIDYERCTHCMQCLSFCLFGVYTATTEGKIKVQNEDNCKTNCPACSRVCPEVAIMFPKYAGGPINGDVVQQADVNREKVKVDVSALLGGDIYKALRERSVAAKSRFSKERDPDRALQERLKCLNKLQQQLDVPPDVLRSLPSPDEILRKAQEAQTAAQAALKLAQSKTN